MKAIHFKHPLKRKNILRSNEATHKADMKHYEMDEKCESGNLYSSHQLNISDPLAQVASIVMEGH